jgi:ATPase subunit of ABC transporter with duplicated ATPase domains
LVLDEPTTYLDPLSQRLILDAIKSYKGALLIVSHNQEFIDELNVDQTFFLPDNIVKNKLTI